MFDIGANLLDPMFQGHYHGSARHPEDLHRILARAFDGSMSPHPVGEIMVTASTLAESLAAMELCAGAHFGPEVDPYRSRLHHTMGVHPTQSDDFFAGSSTEEGDPEGHLTELRAAVVSGVERGKCVAIGEAGLDYARLKFASKERQMAGFLMQIGLAEETRLPMFLHDRETEGDFERVMRENRGRITGGVVHSFTGSLAEAEALLELDLYIGINGCSLKTEENLEVVRALPAERIMLETDAPWCGIRPTHAGSTHVRTTWPAKDKKKWSEDCCVKGRCEPCHIAQVLEVVCAVRGEEDIIAFREQVTENSRSLFLPGHAEKKVSR